MTYSSKFRKLNSKQRHSIGCRWDALTVTSRLIGQSCVSITHHSSLIGHRQWHHARVSVTRSYKEHYRVQT